MTDKMRPHTTHFNDCGCLSARKDAEIAALQDVIKDVTTLLEVGMCPGCRAIKRDSHGKYPYQKGRFLTEACNGGCPVPTLALAIKQIEEDRSKTRGQPDARSNT